MIQIAGSAHRAFIFPADLPEAFAYYGDVKRSFRFLRHISVVGSNAAGHYRLLYCAVESGLYRVNIYCDVLTVVDKNEYRIRISPVAGNAPIKSEAGLYSMTGQGFYNSEIIFSECGDQTRIEYSMRLNAILPIPITLRIIPNALINSIAQNNLHLHMGEITGSFIERSIQAYLPG